jgi:hypothetical protein
MMYFYDRASFARALTLDLDPRLHALLARRIGNLATELIDYTEYLVVERGDTEGDIIRYIGLSPLIEPMGGIRFGKPGFQPHWDYLAAHDGWFEFIFTFGSAFAYVLLVESRNSETDLLQRLCMTYTSSSGE